MKKIIHIDNSDFFRKQMAAFLEKEGFEAECFNSAQEANLTIGSGLCDMVIMGLTFADMEAEEFLSKAAESSGVPIIVVSSSLDNEKEKQLKKMGVKAAISKDGSWQDTLRPFLSGLKG